MRLSYRVRPWGPTRWAIVEDDGQRERIIVFVKYEQDGWDIIRKLQVPTWVQQAAETVETGDHLVCLSCRTEWHQPSDHPSTRCPCGSDDTAYAI